MRSLLRTFIIVLLAVIVFAIIFGAVRASADEPPTKTVAWVVTSGSFDDRFATPQRLATDADTCGVLEQVDTYRYDTSEHIATVDDLIAGGTLTSSAEDSSVWISNQDVTLPVCVVVTPPVTTPPATSSPTSAPTSTPIPSTSQTPQPSQSPTSASVPSPIPSTSSSATVTSSPILHRNAIAQTSSPAASLAFTGSRDELPLAIGAAVLVLLGLVMVIRAHVIKANKTIDEAPRDRD